MVKRYKLFTWSEALSLARKKARDDQSTWKSGGFGYAINRMIDNYMDCPTQIPRPLQPISVIREAPMRGYRGCTARIVDRRRAGDLTGCLCSCGTATVWAKRNKLSKSGRVKFYPSCLRCSTIPWTDPFSGVFDEVLDVTSANPGPFIRRMNRPYLPVVSAAPLNLTRRNHSRRKGVYYDKQDLMNDISDRKVHFGESTARWVTSKRLRRPRGVPRRVWAEESKDPAANLVDMQATDYQRIVNDLFVACVSPFGGFAIYRRSPGRNR